VTTDDGKDVVSFPGHSIPEMFAGKCVNHEPGDCPIFDIRGYRSCPVCGSDKSITITASYIPATPKEEFNKEEQ
jgi:hypothetical protein